MLQKPEDWKLFQESNGLKVEITVAGTSTGTYDQQITKPEANNVDHDDRLTTHYPDRRDIGAEIDADIYRLAAEDRHSYNSVIVDDSSKSFRGKARTVINGQVVVNIFDKIDPILNLHTTNTKTPTNTPSLPVHQLNIISQIPFSTQTLLQRSLQKLNFLSSKQQTQPAEPLFKAKSDCTVNFSSFWDNNTQSFAVDSSYDTQKHNRCNLPSQNATLTHTCTSKPKHSRKRKLSSDTEVSPPTKRKNTGKPKPNHHKQTVPSFDLFAAPLYIPTKHAVSSVLHEKRPGTCRQQ